MNKVKTILKLSATILVVVTNLNIYANTATKCDSRVVACGTAQLDANKCTKDAAKATSGAFESLAAKITSGDLGKTAGDKAAGQTANLICKDKIEKAEAACKPSE